MFTTVYPKKYAHGFCFAVLCCGYTLTDFPISTRLTSLALWQSNDCPSASKATLMNMDEYFMWIHYERLHNHNKAKHNKTVCIFLGIYCIRGSLYSGGVCYCSWSGKKGKAVFHYIMIKRFLHHLPFVGNPSVIRGFHSLRVFNKELWHFASSYKRCWIKKIELSLIWDASRSYDAL